MAKNGDGQCCGKSETEVFYVTPTQNEIEESWTDWHNPTTSIVNSATVEFTIPSSPITYIDPANTCIEVRGRVYNGNNRLLNDIVGPVNLFLHSIFSQVEVSLNGTIISSAENNYPYRAYLETLLNYGNDAKESHLRNALWIKDTAGEMNDTECNANTGLAERARAIVGSREFDMIGKLHGDFFSQEKLLVNNVEMKIKLVRGRDTFSLMYDRRGLREVPPIPDPVDPADNEAVAARAIRIAARNEIIAANEQILAAPMPNYRFDITDVQIGIRRVKLTSKKVIEHTTALQRNIPAVYPISRVHVRPISIAQGKTAVTLDNIFQGQLPKRVIIGFVPDEALHGAPQLNPFDFRHYNIDFLSLYMQGVQIPRRPLQPNFEQRLYASSYQTLFDGTGILNGNAGNSISWSDYGHGYTLWAFDLTPDQSANCGTHVSERRTGGIRLVIHFALPLPHTIACVVYGEFDNIVSIDKQRSVSTDFGQ
jgi:hypothetical protein